jgi:hypothetical protein
MSYQARPIDTANIQLPAEIIQLTELLARNAHENWVKQRTSEGWRYGPKRDDARNEHPCLVPYEQLSESEKEYDRKTAMETVKAIRALGYQIVK